MKIRTKFLSLIFGTTIATSAIIAPSIALSSCSNGSDSSNGTGNNNQGGNGSNKPATPLPQADTSNITTFAGAIQFTNKYLKENYKLENLRDDISYTGKIWGLRQPPSPQNPLPEKSAMEVKKIVAKPNNKIDLEIEYGGGRIWGFLNCSVFTYFGWNEQNNSLVPQISINTQGSLLLLPFFPFFNISNTITSNAITYNSSNAASVIYNSLEELKQANPDWETKSICYINDLKNSHIVRSMYILLPDTPPTTNQIFKLNISPPFDPLSNGTSFFMKDIFSFYNIPKAEIQDHLYQPPKPQPSQTQPQP